jgi:hypothetical protein
MDQREDHVRVETRKKRVILFELSWKHACQIPSLFATLPMSMNNHTSTVSIHLRVMNKF